MSHREHMRYGIHKHTHTHICMQRGNGIALSDLLEWYFSWVRLTHSGHSQQFVAQGIPWQPQAHICWTSACSAPLTLYVRCVCPRVDVLALHDLSLWLLMAAMWQFFASSAKCMREDAHTLHVRRRDKDAGRSWERSHLSVLKVFPWSE